MGTSSSKAFSKDAMLYANIDNLNEINNLLKSHISWHMVYAHSVLALIHQQSTRHMNEELLTHLRKVSHSAD